MLRQVSGSAGSAQLSCYGTEQLRQRMPGVDAPAGRAAGNPALLQGLLPKRKAAPDGLTQKITA
ncbi:MAG: hypothetical protein GX883_08000 [Firmicutes bacterium]|nr:hypothetical protein [Bacillota bacterium]